MTRSLAARWTNQTASLPSPTTTSTSIPHNNHPPRICDRVNQRCATQASLPLSSSRTARPSSSPTPPLISERACAVHTPSLPVG
jgi:hypothetical protein